MAWEEILKKGIGISETAFSYALEFMQDSGMSGEFITSKELYYNLRNALEILSKDTESNQVKRGFIISYKASSNLDSTNPNRLIDFAIKELGVPVLNKFKWYNPNTGAMAGKRIQLHFKVPTKDEWKNPFR